MTESDDNLISSIEDDPIAKQLPDRATFIPLRETDLREQLAAHYDFDEHETGKFRTLCDRLQRIFHVEHLPVLLDLEELYDSVDPDSQHLDLESEEPAYRDAVTSKLVDRLSGLLYRAHYKRLTREEMLRAIQVGREWGQRIEVDFEIFDRLEIFARGYNTVTKQRRRWRNFYRLETIELPEFQRLILGFRVRAHDENRKSSKADKDLLDNKFVYLKAFKNIPETDIEMLLPGTKVLLTKFDRAKILFPTVSGLAITLYKIGRGVLVLSLAFTLHQLYDQLLGWIIFLGASGTYIFKSVMSYFRTKSQYQFGLTKSLYLKNLENNLGVIYRILNEAEEQELCEAMLAYTVLWKDNQARGVGLTSKELDNVVEQFLLETTAIDVDFEVHDALGKLARLDLAKVCYDGKWSVTGIDDANKRLAEKWQEL